VELGGAGWSWVELGGAGWSWVELSGAEWSCLELSGAGWSCMDWSWLQLTGASGVPESASSVPERQMRVRTRTRLRVQVWVHVCVIFCGIRCPHLSAQLHLKNGYIFASSLLHLLWVLRQDFAVEQVFGVQVSGGRRRTYEGSCDWVHLGPTSRVYILGRPPSLHLGRMHSHDTKANCVREEFWFPY